MKIEIETPTVAWVTFDNDTQRDVIRAQLTYTNTANQFLVNKHQRNFYWKQSNRVTWEAHLKELQKSVVNTLVYAKDGRFFIRPASISYLELPSDTVIENKIVYPKAKAVAWAKKIPFDFHYYQDESWQNLLQSRHANVELCTGAGKSAILLRLCRESGFRTAIIAPSKSIFEELVEKFEYHLGKVHVGKFGNGKKVLGKRFTICIGDSISNIKPGTKEWEFFSGLEMIAVDESHTWGAESLDEICHGVLANVPIRLFLSGTQTRGDGGEKMLQSIIGPTVCTLTTADAVRKGFICPHEFKIVRLQSSNPNFQSKDGLEMKRNHFLRNRNIAEFIAKLANATAQAQGKQTLVLVEELNQISMLSKLLQVPFAYAHSESKPERLEELGLMKVDPSVSVEKFNRNEVKVLIGTSCIATGTNIFPTHNTVNWVGGSSEIKTKQGAVGRSVRFLKNSPWADKCVAKDKAIIWDFYIEDNYMMEGQFKKRIECYRDSEADISVVKLSR